MRSEGFLTFSLRAAAHANVAQQAERRTRNAQAAGSNPAVSSNRAIGTRALQVSHNTCERKVTLFPFRIPSLRNVRAYRMPLRYARIRRYGAHELPRGFDYSYFYLLSGGGMLEILPPDTCPDKLRWESCRSLHPHAGNFPRRRRRGERGFESRSRPQGIWLTYRFQTDPKNS